MARKFLLVGIFVVVTPGTVMQVALGTIVSAAYLMVQLQASPYKSRSDDYLAVASSFGMLMVFMCAQAVSLRLRNVLPTARPRPAHSAWRLTHSGCK